MDMTVDELNDNGRGGNPLVAIIVILLILFAIAFAMTLSAHALERHGDDAVYVKTCQIKNGTHETWTRDEDGRQANIVLCDDGKFGIEICEPDGVQVTCFLKEKMRGIEKVYRYLRNRGYEP